MDDHLMVTVKMKLSNNFSSKTNGHYRQQHPCMHQPAQSKHRSSAVFAIFLSRIIPILNLFSRLKEILFCCCCCWKKITQFPSAIYFSFQRLGRRRQRSRYVHVCVFRIIGLWDILYSHFNNSRTPFKNVQHVFNLGHENKILCAILTFNASNLSRT